MDQLPEIRLRNGAVVKQPLEAVRTFMNEDGSYQSYDLVSVPRDCRLTESDVRLANKMVARMSDAVIESVLRRGFQIARALNRIPPDACLLESPRDIPWDAMEDLLGATMGPEVGLARATKILHKKRPRLMPILDSVIREYLLTVDGVPYDDTPEDGVALVRSFKGDLDANAQALRGLRVQLRNMGHPFSECRLLDILIWSASGTYTPTWKS